MDWQLRILCQTKTREALQNQRSENMSELQPVINWPKNASSALSKLLDLAKSQKLFFENTLCHLCDIVFYSFKEALQEYLVKFSNFANYTFFAMSDVIKNVIFGNSVNIENLGWIHITIS